MASNRCEVCSCCSIRVRSVMSRETQNRARLPLQRRRCLGLDQDASTVPSMQRHHRDRVAPFAKRRAEVLYLALQLGWVQRGDGGRRAPRRCSRAVREPRDSRAAPDGRIDDQQEILEGVEQMLELAWLSRRSRCASICSSRRSARR